MNGEPGNAPACSLNSAFGGGDRAVALDADLDRHRRTRGRAGGAEHVLAAHHDLHRMAGLLRQHDADGLDINHGLAAERAADLGRVNAQIADLHVEQRRGVVADDEMSLARAPQLALAVGIETRDAALRLDIGLMHGRGLERHLDDLVGRRETRLDVTEIELVALGDVGWRLRVLDRRASSCLRTAAARPASSPRRRR